MIINDLDISCLVINPIETNTLLVIDADTVLTGSVAFQFLEPIARWCEQILKVLDVIEVDQFSTSSTLNIFWQLRGKLTREDLLSPVGGKRIDHKTTISRHDNIIKPPSRV
jgi:hypothetical protein